jgi:hypothetical protein
LAGQAQAVLLGEQGQPALAANLADERHDLIANQMRSLLQMTCIKIYTARPLFLSREKYCREVDRG